MDGQDTCIGILRDALLETFLHRTNHVVERFNVVAGVIERDEPSDCLVHTNSRLSPTSNEITDIFTLNNTFEIEVGYFYDGENILMVIIATGFNL